MKTTKINKTNKSAYALLKKLNIKNLTSYDVKLNREFRVNETTNKIYYRYYTTIILKTNEYVGYIDIFNITDKHGYIYNCSKYNHNCDIKYLSQSITTISSCDEVFAIPQTKYCDIATEISEYFNNDYKWLINENEW